MKLDELRSKYPEYDDVSDEELLEALHNTHYADMPMEAVTATVVQIEAPKPEPIIPALNSIEDAVTQLHEAIKYNKPIDNSAGMIEILKQIKNGLSKIETAIAKIDTQPLVTVEAPVVHVPKIVIPEFMIPEHKLPKIWTFEVTRNKNNGLIESVTARA